MMGLPTVVRVRAAVAAGQPHSRTEAFERFALEPCASTARGLPLKHAVKHAERSACWVPSVLLAASLRDVVQGIKLR